MTTVTIRVASINEFKKDIIAAMGSDDTKRGEFITFPTWEALYKALSPKKMDILHAMAGAGDLTFRDIASLVGRDVKGVHTDVTALLKAGIVEKTHAGVVFPYDAIHFDFTLGNVAA